MTSKQKARELNDKKLTIEEIITSSQKKRHDNHVKAGKGIKKKWINQGRLDMKKEILEKIILWHSLKNKKWDDRNKNNYKSFDNAVQDLIKEIENE
jgi:hypothetical protein